MNFIQKSIFITLVPLFFSFSAKADINVVTTIKPLHSLISSVMEGVGEPSLIIEGTNNPHTFVFKPSHAEMIENADIVFWIGEDLEAFMEKPLDSLAKDAKKIAFMELSSIEKLKFREENIFDESGKMDLASFGRIKLEILAHGGSDVLQEASNAKLFMIRGLFTFE